MFRYSLTVANQIRITLADFENLSEKNLFRLIVERSHHPSHPKVWLEIIDERYAEDVLVLTGKGFEF